MSRNSFYSGCFIFALVVVACSFRHKEKPVDPELLLGKYYKNIDPRDSIFVYSDKTYNHTYHRTDGTVNSQINTWRYKSNINDIFFESFLFFNDHESESGEYDGSWASHVFVTEEGQVKLRYSESVYYLKTTKEITNPNPQNK